MDELKQCNKCLTMKHIDKCANCIIQEYKESLKIRVGMLRQWLNEDRIDDTNKMVDNEDIEHWLDINKNIN